MREQAYNEYIKKCLETYGESLAGMCGEMSRAMSSEFPELEVVGGTVDVKGPFGSTHTVAHFWCVDDAGEIWDPTESQFVEILGYNQMEDAKKGMRKCMNCGTISATNDTFCSRECEQEAVYSL